MTNDNLESSILEKAVRRFRRANLKKIEEKDPREEENFKSVNYILEVNEFKLNLHYYENFIKNQRAYSLIILSPEGKQVEYFNSLNEQYNSILKDIYLDIKNRFTEKAEKDEYRENRKSERKIRRLKRIL